MVPETSGTILFLVIFFMNLNNKKKAWTQWIQAFLLEKNRRELNI